MLTVANAHLQALVGKFKSEEGAGIVEYVLLIVAIALVVLVAMQLLSNSLSDTFERIGNEVSNAPGGGA